MPRTGGATGRPHHRRLTWHPCLTTVSTDDLAARIAAATAGLQAQGWGAMLVSPGPDLTYLTGYDAIPLERLTCLSNT